MDYISGPCLALRVGDVSSDRLVLLANVFVLRESMCLSLSQCIGSVLHCCMEMSHSHLKILRESGTILDIVIERGAQNTAAEPLQGMCKLRKHTCARQL